MIVISKWVVDVHIFFGLFPLIVERISYEGPGKEQKNTTQPRNIPYIQISTQDWHLKDSDVTIYGWLKSQNVHWESREG